MIHLLFVRARPCRGFRFARWIHPSSRETEIERCEVGGKRRLGERQRERERERVSSPSLKIFPPKEKEKTEEPGGGGGREGNGKRDEKHAPPSGEHD